MKKVDRKFEARPAVVLIAVLWTVALITTIVVVVARSSLLDTRVSMTTAENVRGHWACRAAVEKVIAVLAEDDPSVDSFAEPWYDSPADFNDVPLDGCMFNAVVTDESGRLNVNTASKEQLMQLPYMTEEVADSIIDWRDQDEDVTGDGAEAGYYLDMEHGYTPANGPFKSMGELLRVRGIDNDVFYTSGWDRLLTCYSAAASAPTAAAGSVAADAETTEAVEKVNVNQASEQQLTSQLSLGRGHAKWIVENRQFESLGDLLAQNSPDQPQGNAQNSDQALPLDKQTFFSILDRVTLGEADARAGKVNINTAPQDVLLAVFEGDQEIVGEIMSLRNGSDQAFASLADLASVGSLTTEKIRSFIGNLSVNSSVFRIQAKVMLETTGTIRTATAVIDRSQSPVKILYYYEGFSRGGATRNEQNL